MPGAICALLIERATDAAARVLFAAAPPEAVDELMRGLEPLARAVAASGLIPYPNPIGVPALADGPRPD